MWVSHTNGACDVKFLAPPPGAPGRGQKVKCHLISITKSISKTFNPNFVCVLTNERYKTYQTGFLWCRLGHALGVRLGVLRGQNQIPSCCLSVMLSPPKQFDEFNQIWCVDYFHEWGVQRQNCFWPRPLGPRGGVKRWNIIQFQLQSQFQRFLFQTLCVYSQMKDTKHIRRDFYSVAWVMP